MSAGPAPGAPELPRTTAALEEGRQQGLHLGAQLYVSLGGEVVADAAYGEDRPGVALSRDALVLWLSSSKPVTAVALARLWERGVLDLDDPIARHLPEFAQGGKEAVTLRHALTHTGGFRMLDVGWPELSWDEIVARVCAVRREPRWPPGRRAGYHMAGSWFVLGEVIRRLAGRPFERFVREEVFEPLGMSDSWIGMPARRAEAYARSGRLATTYDTAEGEPRLLGWETPERLVRPSPAGGGRGPVRELGRFYEMLLGRGRLGGARILSPQSVEALTARHRVGMFDHTFRVKMDWGLGFIPDSSHYGGEVPYAYGPHCSPRTFGHSGMRSSTGFADPEHGLAVGLAFNSLAGDAAHQARMTRVLGALYEDLGLA